jgi:hypothetical protein
MAALFDPPGTPFGTAHHRERDRIREHLRRRGFDAGDDMLAPARFEDRVSEIQRRLHRYDETFAERSVRLRERWEAEARANRTEAGLNLTRAELEHLVELFDGANDPLSASIRDKAAALLERAFA